MPTTVTIREPKLEDKDNFLKSVQNSRALHDPWVNPPQNANEFEAYLQRYELPNHKSYVVIAPSGELAGVYSISQIIQGIFQNAYLGFYAFADFANQGCMSAGLKLVLRKAFDELKLHRLEANIQPENFNSIQLVKRNGFRYEGFSPRYLKINDVWCGHEHWAMTHEDFIRNNEEVVKRDHVAIAPYDTAWPMMAAKEIHRIQTFFTESKLLDIEHVGSTAIEGMAAKPIIDLQIAVRSLEDSKPLVILALQKLGYEYWAENPDSTRLFFVKGMPPYGERRTHHVHVFEQYSDHWNNKIIFRDYLRAHPDLAREYENLKMKLASEYAEDREKYTDEKLDFVNNILALAAKDKK